ncbi:MAG: 50S ribosomal protein L23 [Holosporales bacterium]|jgi:large subunit ribosomal protein L23|nr:50S ribosomal protein L23 [Holosporales bacterium]
MANPSTQNKTVFADYCILRAPVISEKFASVSECNQVCFIVDNKASKKDIKNAVERVFDVNVVSVQTIIRKGKQRMFKGRRARLGDKKHAIVRLADGQRIAFDGV